MGRTVPAASPNEGPDHGHLITLLRSFYRDTVTGEFWRTKLPSDHVALGVGPCASRIHGVRRNLLVGLEPGIQRHLALGWNRLDAGPTRQGAFAED